MYIMVLYQLQLKNNNNNKLKHNIMALRIYCNVYYLFNNLTR